MLGQALPPEAATAFGVIGLLLSFAGVTVAWVALRKRTKTDETALLDHKLDTYIDSLESQVVSQGAQLERVARDLDACLKARGEMQGQMLTMYAEMGDLRRRIAANGG